MKKYNEKTFNLVAKTSKGNFKVEVNVWQELKSAQSFQNVMMWESEVSVLIDGIKMSCSKYDKYHTDSIHSFEACKYFNVPSNAKIRCDSSEVKNYIDSIDNENRKEMAKAMQKDEDEIKRFEFIHNA